MPSARPLPRLPGVAVWAPCCALPSPRLHMQPFPPQVKVFGVVFVFVFIENCRPSGMCLPVQRRDRDPSGRCGDPAVRTC